MVDKCIKELLDKILAPKPVVSTVPEKNLVIGLPYLGKLSLQIRTRINRIMKNKLPYCNIQRSKFASVVGDAEAFAEAYLHFIVFASAIKMPRQLNF